LKLAFRHTDNPPPCLGVIQSSSLPEPFFNCRLNLIQTSRRLCRVFQKRSRAYCLPNTTFSASFCSTSLSGWDFLSCALRWRYRLPVRGTTVPAKSTHPTEWPQRVHRHVQARFLPLFVRCWENSQCPIWGLIPVDDGIVYPRAARPFIMGPMVYEFKNTPQCLQSQMQGRLHQRYS
jgi:hypothetical protein